MTFMSKKNSKKNMIIWDQNLIAFQKLKYFHKMTKFMKKCMTKSSKKVCKSNFWVPINTNFWYKNIY